MLVMTGASASGKTEIAKIIIHKYGFKKMVTYTTRPKREGEENGIDYHFISLSEFEAKARQGEFLETTLYNHNYYGTAFKDASYDKVLIVDTKGANILHEQLKNRILIFFLETPKTLRMERMKERGDAIEDIFKRLACDDRDFARDNMHHIDFIIENSHAGLEELADEIYRLYCEHMKK